MCFFVLSSHLCCFCVVFNKIANGVFKIEMIGDCYFVVTGLPEPCKDYAVVLETGLLATA